VVRQLHAAGHAVRILARHRPQEGSATEVCLGDVTNAASLANATQGMDAVIHLVGIISELGTATFENVHTRGTENILSAARQSGVKRFVHMSALGTRPNAASRYHQTKWAAEEAVRASGLAWTIFRPSVIYGPGDGFISMLARMVRRLPVVPVIGDGRQRLQPVAVEHVAAGFARAVSVEAAVKQTYTVTGPDAVSMVELLSLIGAVLHRRVRVARIPLGLIRPLATILHRAPSFPVTPHQLLILEEESTGDAAPFYTAFGLTPLPLARGLRQLLG